MNKERRTDGEQSGAARVMQIADSKTIIERNKIRNEYTKRLDKIIETARKGSNLLLSQAVGVDSYNMKALEKMFCDIKSEISSLSQVHGNQLIALAEEVRRSGDTRLANMAIAALANAENSTKA